MLPLPEKTDGDINYAAQANNSVPAIYISALNSLILRLEKAIVRVNRTMNEHNEPFQSNAATEKGDSCQRRSALYWVARKKSIQFIMLRHYRTVEEGASTYQNHV